jgi:hypothetical protein
MLAVKWIYTKIFVYFMQNDNEVNYFINSWSLIRWIRGNKGNLIQKQKEN